MGFLLFLRDRIAGRRVRVRAPGPARSRERRHSSLRMILRHRRFTPSRLPSRS